ncbi:SusC/RagA family TonB-linked outer membrane protein [Pedobacter sp. MC2016-24]|uniref:SusC/RagA family TonB-linked outer membrane protein n=1 Tax=Pedobacter sp. MC2016-24 TaxID=2780090 RepID=UPI00187EB73C|nr:SusC/RagA family TonB-linked outer membrane protein [Pedobacter sp. MC2016-24]MBE9600821.1 SusC/RagA family TonB-linked outer membrane protein [Pedobacter sp. MC2016-24]
MKLTTVLLLAACLQVSAKVSGQNISISQQNMTLENVFKEIHQKTGYQFFYKVELLEKAKKININVKDATVEQVLKLCFKDSPLNYVIKEKAIFIKEKPEKQESFKAFFKEITGKVMDENGKPLISVSVTVIGEQASATTDINGNFKINAPEEGSLKITYVGYKTITVLLNGKNYLELRLEPEVYNMNEVVVTALGITRKKRSLAYAVAEVKGEELTKGGSANLVKSLDGRMSGVNFTQASTDPAGSVFVTIRGATSLNLPQSTANSQPLYIIDGIPMGTTSITSKNNVDFGNLLSQLNPEDIESISVLKGASAGVLYGAQAGNGVIMITTKSGKGNKNGLGIAVNTSMVIDKPYNFFETQTEYGVGVRSAPGGYVAGGAYDWGPKLDGSFNITRWNTLTQQNENVPFLGANENRLKAFMVDGHTNNYNVSIAGNSDKGAFRFSVGKMDNKGIMPNNQTNRMTFNLNADYLITKNVKLAVNANYLSQYSPNKSSANNDVVELLTFSFLSHFQPVADMKNIWLNGYEGIKQNAPAFKPNGDPYTDNPYMFTSAELNTYRKDNFFGKAELEWKLTDPLKLLLRSGMDYNGDNYEYKLSKGFSDNNKKDGRYTVEATSAFAMNSDLMLMWNKDFGKISTSATAGYNYAYSNSYNNYADAGKLVRANDFSLGNAVAGTLMARNAWGIGKTQSGYLTTQIGYDNQVFVDLAGRYDQGGILEEDKNHHFYPSASLSWIPSETFRFPELINLFKLRGGIAQVGHGIGRPRSNNTFSFNPIDYGPVKILNIGGQLVDPNIQAEVTNSYEAGFDLALVNKRISFDLTVFNKTHKNQQDFIPTSPGTGYTGMLTNVGTVQSKGIEMGLTLVPVKSKDWNWDLSAFFTKSDAKITKLSKAYVPNGYTFYSNGPNLNIRMAEGEKIGTLWEGNVFERMPAGSKYAGMIVLDNTGQWKYSSKEADRKPIGNYNPDFILGFNSAVRYKAFRLSMVASLRVGGDYVSNVTRRSVTNGHSKLTIGDNVNGPNDYTAGGRDAASGGFAWPNAENMQYPYMAALVKNYKNYGAYTQDASYFKGVWLKTGGDPNNDNDYIVNGADPSATFYYLPGNVLGQQYWSFSQTLIRDATNLKIKELMLDYAIPAKLLKPLKLQSATISLVGRNIFQWNKSGEKGDPEAAFDGIGTNQGIIGKALPSVASYGFKLAVNF